MEILLKFVSCRNRNEKHYYRYLGLFEGDIILYTPKYLFWKLQWQIFFKKENFLLILLVSLSPFATSFC